VERGIAISEEIARRIVPRKRLAKLLRGPRRGRMVGDTHVHDAPALVGQNHQDEQQATRRSWHEEEARRHDLADVIPEECPPSL
jgi:hypothetical protein